MDEQANKLVQHLTAAGALQLDDRIGVMMDRSEKLIIALLAVLKTGAAYVPLPPLYPENRLKHIADGSRLKMLLTEHSFGEISKEITDTKTFYWEDVPWDVLKEQRPERLSVANSLMYAIFTSGSTGGPKGMAIEHRSVVAYLSDKTDGSEARKTDAVAHYLCF